MNILSLKDVGKSVGNGVLFEEVVLGLEEGEKVGLVGRNGSGKSTLLRLLHGTVDPDEGSISRARGLRIASLPQRPAVPAGLTIDDYLLSEPDLVGGRPDYEDEARLIQSYRAICTQLGAPDGGARVDTLSGGLLKKVAIARCLAADAGLVTLDEPTNHLDLDAVLWLEQRLKSLSTAFVMVTHDRRMLDAVCTTIFEISDRRVYRHPGGYSAYVRRRAERLDERDAAEQRRTTVLRRELDWLQRGPKARTGKDRGRKDRIDDLLQAAPEQAAGMDALPAARRRLGKKILRLHGIGKRYDDRPVIGDFSYEFSPGERIGIIGPNGSGKTTLLDIIAGRTRPDHGTVEAGETVAFAYFDQTGSRIDGRKTVLEYLKDHAERVRVGDGASVSAERFLERFLFPRSMFAQPIERLSGGELRRLYLVRLLATAPNFLLLDEPTNDLDLETLRILEQYLDDFTGCLLLVSHDRALLERLTDALFIFDGMGTIEPFAGDYDAYRAERAVRDDEVAAAQAARERRRVAADPAGTDARRAGREQRRGLSYREAREFERLPDEVAELDAELKELEQRFQAESHDPAELERHTRRYHALREEVERKTGRWEELAERAEE